MRLKNKMTDIVTKEPNVVTLRDRQLRLFRKVSLPKKGRCQDVTFLPVQNETVTPISV